ncbi:amidase [Streptosporangiaceae bacterium NEAU-GS5]|nr:amidase [Streptosporangiaceae bacterium NEAU-GS5]
MVDYVTLGPFAGLTLADVARMLRDGATDAVDLVGRALEATAQAQPALNAFVTVDERGARAAAERARDELARGLDRGPLHGVPVAVKDIIDTAGLLTTMGSRHFAGHVPDRDADVVTRLREAGAVIVGKTTTHEFAYGPTGDRSANGPGANPHDPSRMAGGSSAGSAAAVAAGLVPFALGTDTGGSVRIPAALCGVAGLRPTSGALPMAGVFPLSRSLDTVGPIANDVGGVALGWAVLSGTAAGVTPSPLAELRVGLPVGDRLDQVDDTVGSALERLVSRLAAGGATIRQVAVPDVAELREIYRLVQSAEAYGVHRDRLAAAPELFGAEVRDRLRTAGQVTAPEYAAAMARLTELRETAAGRFDGVDVLLLPAAPVLAPPLDARDGDFGGGWTSPRDALLAFNTPWSVLGLPAMSVPLPAKTLPVGAQLVGPPAAEAAVLAAAAVVAGVVEGP